MNYARMEEISEELFTRYRELRESKGREYAPDEDTLADFKEVAAEVGVTPLQCWAIYVKKHERARDTFVREGAVKSESIQSRIDDIVTYHALLLGLVEDELIERESVDRRAVLDARAMEHAKCAGDRIHVDDAEVEESVARGRGLPRDESPWSILQSHANKIVDEAEIFAIRHELKMHGHYGEFSASGNRLLYREGTSVVTVGGGMRL
jgi:hypothetical protein